MKFGSFFSAVLVTALIMGAIGSHVSRIGDVEVTSAQPVSMFAVPTAGPSVTMRY